MSVKGTIQTSIVLERIDEDTFIVLEHGRDRPYKVLVGDQLEVIVASQLIPEPKKGYSCMNTLVQPPDVLRAAAAHMEDRAATYDSPSGERSMSKAVDMLNTLTGGPSLTVEQGWLFMAILKMVRSQQGDFKLDNYEDLAAYAALAAEEAAETRNRTGT